jgi:hypothetical protein
MPFEMSGSQLAQDEHKNTKGGYLLQADYDDALKQAQDSPIPK